MIKELVDGAFLLRKAKGVVFIGFGAFLFLTSFPQSKDAVLAWMGSGDPWTTLVDVHGRQLATSCFGLLFLALSVAEFRRTDGQWDAARTHPLVRFLEPSHARALGERPDMKEAVETVKRKLGMEDGKPLWFPGKRIDKLLKEDPEFAQAWQQMQEIARRDLEQQNRP